MTEEITYEIKQLFATYNGLFKDNIDEIINDYDLTRKEKMAEIVEMGKRLDKELKRQGVTRKYYGKLPYEERARRYVKKMKGGKYGLSKEETMESMVKAGGIVTEERMPYIIFGLGGVVKSYEIKKISRTVNGKKIFTSDTLDILDAVAHKVYQRYQKKIKQLRAAGESTKVELRNVEELIALAESYNKKKFIKSPKRHFSTVVISEGEIRKFVNKPNYSTSQITERVKNIGHFTLEGTVPIFCGRDGWINVPVTGGFAEVWIAKEEERYFKYRSKRKLRGKGKGREENVFIIRFIGTWGTAYMLNILNNYVTVFPPRFYKDLSASAKTMFRAICGKGVSIINIHQINKIFDWEEPMKNVPQRIIRIEKIWKELYKHGFIKKFTRYKKEDGTIYWRVERRKNWFNPPRQIEKTG